jgi:hypothetical protein
MSRAKAPRRKEGRKAKGRASKRYALKNQRLLTVTSYQLPVKKL